MNPVTTSNKFICVSFLMLFIAPLQAQTLNSNWKQDLAVSLEKFIKCEPSSETCNGYVGESLYTVYRLKDFQSKSGKYMTVNEIARFLKETDKWSILGHPYDQKVLEQAQEHANSKKAVVAVYMNSAGIGHVVLIIPGDLQSSGSWGLKVPNSTSFLLSEPTKSYLDKGLSFALGKNLMKDIVLYARSY